jgi:hypothetical protein
VDDLIAAAGRNEPVLHEADAERVHDERRY